MDARLGWALAVLAVAMGFWQWGWPGVALGFTLIVFWMLLQFSRTMRIMGKAGEAPVGSVKSAVMLQAKLRPGLVLLDILPLTRSLGVKTSDDPETYVWTDGGGDSVSVVLHRGKVERWQLTRAAETAGSEPPAPPPVQHPA
ncbi:MAG TPA: hypothetical protein VLA16_09920 [Ideonella sp.]|nr:hypothetical protein [Ideonella sp.]